MIGGGERVGHVDVIGADFQRGRHGSCPQRLHQMRSDLDDSTQSPKHCAEVLQVGPPLARRPLRLASRPARWYIDGKCRERAMKFFRIAALMALLTAPAYAQTPTVNLMPE